MVTDSLPKVLAPSAEPIRTTGVQSRLPTLAELEASMISDSEDVVSEELEVPGAGSVLVGSPQEHKVRQVAAAIGTNMRDKKDLCLMGVLPRFIFLIIIYNLDYYSSISPKKE